MGVIVLKRKPSAKTNSRGPKKPSTEQGQLPYGYKDPNNMALGPKYCNINGIWALKPYHMGKYCKINGIWA